jgi:hypothetical protein
MKLDRKIFEVKITYQCFEELVHRDIVEEW